MRHVLSFWERIIQTFFLFRRNFPICSTSRDKCQSFSKESVGCRAWHQASWNPEPGSADWIFHSRTSSTWLEAGGWLDQSAWMFRRTVHSIRSGGTSRGDLSSSFLCLFQLCPPHLASSGPRSCFLLHHQWHKSFDQVEVLCPPGLCKSTLLPSVSNCNKCNDRWGMLIMGEVVQGWGRGNWEISVPFPQFCCGPKTSLKNIN